MDFKINKIQLRPGANETILPFDFKLRHFAQDPSNLGLYAWIEVPTGDSISHLVKFLIIRTGESYSSKWRFCGTAVCTSGIAWHLLVEEINAEQPFQKLGSTMYANQ